MTYEEKAYELNQRAEANVESAAQPPTTMSGSEKVERARQLLTKADSQSLLSIAISLDRIADSLDDLVRQNREEE